MSARYPRCAVCGGAPSAGGFIVHHPECNLIVSRSRVVALTRELADAQQALILAKEVNARLTAENARLANKLAMAEGYRRVVAECDRLTAENSLLVADNSDMRQRLDTGICSWDDHEHLKAENARLAAALTQEQAFAEEERDKQTAACDRHREATIASGEIVRAERDALKVENARLVAELAGERAQRQGTVAAIPEIMARLEAERDRLREERDHYRTENRGRLEELNAHRLRLKRARADAAAAEAHVRGARRDLENFCDVAWTDSTRGVRKSLLRAGELLGRIAERAAKEPR